MRGRRQLTTFAADNAPTPVAGGWWGLPFQSRRRRFKVLRTEQAFWEIALVPVQYQVTAGWWVKSQTSIPIPDVEGVGFRSRQWQLRGDERLQQGLRTAPLANPS